MGQVDDYKDSNPAFDYVAGVIAPIFEGWDKREHLALMIMEALFLGESAPLEKYHPKGASLLEQLALRLMGTSWCREWMQTHIYSTDKKD